LLGECGGKNPLKVPKGARDSRFFCDYVYDTSTMPDVIAC
jgi:hypothetical protein